jgi:class 3 adenylate cyclase/HAMP domain-containing protein
MGESNVKQVVSYEEISRDIFKPERIWWLPLLVVLINAGMVGLLVIYTRIGLKPILPPYDESQLFGFRAFVSILAVLLPTVASFIYLRPVFAWLRLLRVNRPGEEPAEASLITVERGGNAPATLAAFCLMTWVLVDVLFFFRIWTMFPRITMGMGVHFFGLPLLAGMIAAASMFFLSEYLCRAYVWPVLFMGTEIGENPGLRKVRVVNRLFLQMIAICFLPLSAVVLTAVIRVDRLTAVNDPILNRVILVIILIGVSATFGGAWLAWAVARSMDRPLRLLERAMARLRAGDFSVRVRVSATDEIGILEEGFNLTAQRLSESYEALEERNRELAEAIGRIEFLEKVKRGLNRFVPDTVSRLIEENPDAPDLHKEPKDVTVLFLDVEGYTRLSEKLTREKLNELIERYFSLYIDDIHAEKGDINETAGDGLMILFQEGNPDEHAASAVRAALSIGEKTTAANSEAGGDHPHISVNIGICSGVCHVGSTRLQGVAGERWTFTATGPVTNLAARLGDRAQKEQIFVNSETAERVKGRFFLENVGLVTLKNVSDPVEVWEAKNNLARSE